MKIHNDHGEIAIPMLMESINKVFEVDPNHRAKVRGHLLDYKLLDQKAGE